jgi:hypothetical protein
MNYDRHEYCRLFPQDAATVQALIVDMSANGFDNRHPIVLYTGKILDGQNRYAAAHALGIEMPTVEFNGGDKAAFEFVMKENLRRRHLTTLQKATIAVQLANMPYGGAKYRRASLNTDNKAQDNTIPDNDISLQQAADLMGVGRSSVAAVKSALAAAATETKQAAEDGTLKSVADLKSVAELPAEIQEDIIAAMKSGEVDSVQKALRTQRLFFTKWEYDGNDYTFHKHSDIVPEFTGEGFQALKDSIKEDGQIKPIIIFENQVLDGRARYRACRELGIVPKTVTYLGAAPRGIIYTNNVFRTNWTPEQIEQVSANFKKLQAESNAVD